MVEVVTITFAGYQVIWPTVAFYEEAIRIQTRYKFQWYDSLILAGALETGCDTLYTEDLQSGQVIEGLTIVNPFA